MDIEKIIRRLTRGAADICMGPHDALNPQFGWFATFENHNGKTSASGDTAIDALQNLHAKVVGQ